MISARNQAVKYNNGKKKNPGEILIRFGDIKKWANKASRSKFKMMLLLMAMVCWTLMLCSGWGWTSFVAAIIDQQYDVLIVGAGLSGMVFADLLARYENLRVLVIDKRDHIGGNCFDYIDEETQILVNQYGAHLFHTDNETVWHYVNRFSEWEAYEHRVIGLADNKLVPIPVNIETVNMLTESTVHTVEEMAEWIDANQLKLDRAPLNGEEAAQQRIGPVLFSKLMEEYTMKQWGIPAKELDPSYLQRIPVIEDWDDRYFPADRFQALPRNGYTEWIKAAFDDPRITVQLETNYFDHWHSKVLDGSAPFTKVFYTGPIDDFFRSDPDVDLEPLGYRSIRFERELKRNTPFHQMGGAVNYNQFADGDFTRIIEYKHFMKRGRKQHLMPHTVIFKEFSTDFGEPYYPKGDVRNQDLFKEYQKLAENKERDGVVHFVGRLANYKYFNMDAAILNALSLYSKLYDHPMDELHHKFLKESTTESREQCPFQISMVLHTEGRLLPSKLKEFCAHSFYKERAQNVRFQIYDKSQFATKTNSYQLFADKLKEFGCTLYRSDSTKMSTDSNTPFHDNLFVKSLPAIGRESESWIHHFIIAPLFDANVFLRGDIDAEIDDIIEALQNMETSLWINSEHCGTRPNTINFGDHNVLKHGVDDNLHFQTFSDLTAATDPDDELCDLLRQIVYGPTTSASSECSADTESEAACTPNTVANTECPAATLSEGGEFVVSNAAVVRMLQKQRTFLWKIYNEFQSKIDSLKEAEPLALQMERLWLPLFSSPKPFKVIVFLFAERKDRMSIIMEYLDILMDRGLIDELHFWEKTRNDGDRQYVEELAKKRANILLFPFKNRGIPWTEPYQFYRDNHDGLDPRDVLIKMDDDILFLDIDEFGGFTQFIYNLQGEDSRTTVFANIINQGVAAYYQRVTASDIEQECKRFLPEHLEKLSICPGDEKEGPFWFENVEDSRSLQQCLLRTGLLTVKTDEIIQHSPVRYSINFLGFQQRYSAEIAQLVELKNGDDELAVSTLARCAGGKAVFYGPLVVAHLSYGPQTKGQIYDGELIPKYREYADKYLEGMKGQ